MRSPVRIWVAAPKKALADAGAFWFVRLPPVGGGYPICGSVSAAPGGLSGIALGFSWGFARRLHPRLSACGLARFSFIIINHKTSVNAGRSSLRVRAFAAVCGISLPCAVFSFAADLPQIPAKMRDLRRNHFFAVGTHSRSALRLSAEKFFPAVARCRAKVSFRRIFRSDRGGAKMRSSKLRKTTHFASLRENLFISRNFLLTNGAVCRIINSSVCRNR